MTKGDVQRSDEKETFDHPHTIVESDTLSYEQKVAALESWKLDLLGLQRAADENMPSANASPGAAGDELRQVLEALAEVREQPVSPQTSE